MNTSIFGINQVPDSISSAFKVISFFTSLNLNNDPTNITKLSISSKCTYVNSFKSLDNDYTTILIDIPIRVDYLDSNNNLLYEIKNISKVVNIACGDYNYNCECIINCNILDLELLSITSNKLSLSLTIHAYLET